MWDPSSPTGDRVCTLCIGRQIRNQWAIREAQCLRPFNGKGLAVDCFSQARAAFISLFPTHKYSASRSRVCQSSSTLTPVFPLGFVHQMYSSIFFT